MGEPMNGYRGPVVRCAKHRHWYPVSQLRRTETGRDGKGLLVSTYHCDYKLEEA